MEINKLIQEKLQITKRLEKLNYGSIEIREKESKKYIYTHFRNEGILTSKYVGEYSNELFQSTNVELDDPNISSRHTQKQQAQHKQQLVPTKSHKMRAPAIV